MIGEINYNLKPRKPRLFLCKPDKTIIANISKVAYNIKFDRKLGELNQLEFNIPYYVEKDNQIVEYKYFDNFKERYLIKLKLGSEVQYFLITEISESDNGGESLFVKTWSLGYQLNDKIIKNYVSRNENFEESPIDIRQALTDALSESISWKAGEIDEELLNTYRSFSIDSQTALDYVFEIAKSFNAIVEWDTENKKINMRHPDNVGTDKGLILSYGKYLRSISKNKTTDEMVTRFYPIGKDGLTIHSVNPTGSGFIEDYSFFMYPFQRDSNKNIIQSSYWMSDSLCNALLDYQELVISKEGKFKEYLDQKEILEGEKSALEVELFDLETELSQIQDRLDVQKKDESLTIYDFVYNGTTVTNTAKLNVNYPFMVMVKLSSTSNIVFKLDGITKTLNANTWTVVGKINNKESTTIEISGSAMNVSVKIYVVQITQEEFDTANNEQELINKYNEDYKQAQVDIKQSEIDAKQSEIDIIDGYINELKEELAIENNFTPEQIEEWDNYIITKDWVNDHIFDAKELLLEGKKEFEKIKMPQTVIEIDIVNFLESIEDQKNWDKLVLGDIITIKHERLGIKIKAKIIAISYDFENGNISLTIANIEDVLTDEEKFITTLYNTVSTSTTVNINKDKWDKAEKVATEFDKYKNSAIETTKQKIIAGTNETVEISRRGLLIKNNDDPNKFIVQNSGVIAITDDGGQNWKIGISTNGIHAPLLIGDMIIGEKLKIINQNGKYTIDENGLTIDGGSLNIINGLPESQIDSNAVNKWNNAEQNAKDYTDEQINQVNQVADNLQNQIDAFSSDNKLTLSEAKTLEALLESFKKESVDLINIATGMSITTEKNNYNNAIMALENELNNKWLNQANYPLNITDTQRNNIKTLIGNVQNAKSILVNKIMQIRQQNAQQYADSLKQQTDSEITDLQNQIDNTNLYIDGAFKDGIIQASEAKAIEKYINALNTEKADIDNQYNAIYNNIYLQDAVKKSDLQTKKADYDSKHAALMNSINTAISDGRTTSAEKANVDEKFNQYKTSLANLSTSLQNAIDDIAKNKANEAKNAAINYTNSQLANYVTQTVYNQDIANLQNQIDGNITSWFYPHDPTLSNEPAINWTTYADKNNHLGDLFYNTTNGYSYRFAYENGQYKWILIKDSDVQKALADAAKAQDTADQKRRVFVNQPTPPYDIGDLWANGQKVYRCKIAKTSGQSFNSADWELVGDVTSQNTSNNTANVGNQPASTVATAVSNFNRRNDRKSTIPANPTIATDGTAIDHTINTDGSADISFEWIFNGSGDAYDIDGFIIYVFQSNSSSQYSFGTSASQEQVFYTTPEKRALILYGVPADRYYTFGIQAYRIVDQDINPSGILKSSIIKPSLTSENPYRPSANVAFTGNVTGTIAGQSASAVVSKANNALQVGTLYNGVKIDTNSGLVVTRSDNKVRTILNATDGIKIQGSVDGSIWTDNFYADTNGKLYAKGLDIDGNSVFRGNLEGASGSFSGSISGATITGSEFTTIFENNIMTLQNSSLTFINSEPVTEPDGTYTYFTEFTNNHLKIQRSAVGGLTTDKTLSLELGKIESESLSFDSMFRLTPVELFMRYDNGLDFYREFLMQHQLEGFVIGSGSYKTPIILKDIKMINSLYNNKKNILYDHENGNVSLSAVGGDLFLGYTNTRYVKVQPSILLFNTGVSIETATGWVKWKQSNNNYIYQDSAGDVAIFAGGVQRHRFYANGTKSGGSIEIDGKVLGMSPIDSPQVLLSTMFTNIEIKSGIENVVFLDEKFTKAITEYAVFSSQNVTITKKENDKFYVISDKDCVADFILFGKRIGYENTYWMDMSS